MGKVSLGAVRSRFTRGKVTQTNKILKTIRQRIATSSRKDSY